MGNSPGQIPVIDLFAGPGGLSEGFARAGMCNWFDGRTTAYSAINNANPGLFRIALSIEKEAVAHKTLELRAFFRQFSPDEAPEDYFSHLRGDISRLELFDAWPAQANAAKSEAWCAELGLEDRTSVDRRIKTALSGADEWVLIGGPPCQAYSLVGRSRNRGIEDYKPEEDQRHFLYREYLRIVAAHRPPVFIMENVKGLLSARINGRLIFDQILDDLRQPGQAVAFNVPGNLQYRLYSFVESPGLGLYEVEQPNDFVIKMEQYGIPQARHRIILLGVRNDLEIDGVNLLPIREPVQLQHVLAGCPPLRSGLSKEPDSPDAWREVVQSVVSNDSLFERSHDDLMSDVRTRMVHAVHSLPNRQKDRGGEFVRCGPRIEYLPGWYLDYRLEGLCNHSTRGHIASDLHRYLFAACWATVHGSSPSLREFPRSLLPAHENANGDSSESMLFADRFRVQIRDRPSTTITSHISKDGHYYIHPDPSQCRSLTVREAARLQTFPDNYFFCGPRTEQYRQVGNAVPPLLAVQIAELTMQILQDDVYA